VYVQVLTQWEIVKDLLFEYSRGSARGQSQESAWQFVLQQRQLADVVDVVQLYVLSQVIATQSADVERGFSLLNHMLGLNRLSTKTVTLDCRLRVKQDMPAPFSNKSEARELQMYLQKQGTEAEGDTSPNAVRIYNQLVVPNSPEPLVQTLHGRLGINNASLWEELAEQFDAVDDVSVHEPVNEAAEFAVADVGAQDGQYTSEMERLLAEGQGMSVDEMARVLAGV
jgi:hypothetical protein